MAQYDVDLREYWRILKKHKLTVLLVVFVLGIFSTSFAILRAPTPLYTSVSSVKFEKETTVEGLYARTLSWSSADDIETQISIIKSYSIMQKVAEKLGKIPKGAVSEKALLKSSIAEAVNDLQAKVKVSRETYTNIINIEVTDTNPAFAQRLANTIALIFKEEHAREQNRRTVDALKYISVQLEEARRKLRESEDEFNRFTQENQLLSIDLQSENLFLRAKEIKDKIRDLDEAENEFNELHLKLEQFLKDPSATGTNLFSAHANKQYQDANDTLVELVLKRDSLLKDYTAKHPEVIEIERKTIETARKMVMITQLQISSINNKKVDLKKELEIVDKKTSELMEKKLEYNRLKRKVDSYNDMTALLEQKNQEASIRKAEKPEEITIVRPAFLPTSPINPPKTAATGMMGVIVGLILGIVIAFIVETFDTSLGAIADVEETLGTQVLGVIPQGDIKSILESLKDTGPKGAHKDSFKLNMSLVSHFAPQSIMAESFRGLRTNIQFRILDKKVKTLSVTSASPQEGKTMVAINLAITMAQAGMKTLLVGSDLRKPMLSKVFGIETSPGLTDVLIGNYSWSDVIKTITDVIIGEMDFDEVMFTPGLDNLHIMTSGTIPPNPSELIDSKRLEDFIEEVKDDYDIIIFDTPPILSTADPLILGAKVDAVVFVYRIGSVSRGLLKRSTLQLSQVKSNLMGVALNGIKAEVSPDFQGFKYYKSYYAYGEEGKGEKEKRKKRRGGALKILMILIALALLVVGLLWQGGVLPIEKYLFKNKGFSKEISNRAVSSSKPSQPIKMPVVSVGSGKTVHAPQEQISVEERSLQPIKEPVSLVGSGGSVPSPEKEVAESNLKISRATEENLLSRPARVFVNVAAANLRSRATTESSILYKLKRGSEVTLVKQKGEWYILKFKDGRTSWGHQSLFLRNGNTYESAVLSQPNEEAESKFVLKVDTGRVREKPSFESQIKYLLKKGDTVTLHEANGDWFLVELEDGTLGWAYKTLFSKKSGPSEPSREKRL
ncbi:MAG: SH3 domain-containing protein [Deltaproteobacteria bacterium]|nr:SH3 domain-containing protein [Deltaproteobacteria bacterium]MBW2114864.1 SH3 domain-containing protein [Deltaproteobacteria bacterium]